MGKPSVLRNGNTWAAARSPAGIRSSGATQPEVKLPSPQHNIQMLVVWVLQNPSNPTVEAIRTATNITTSE